MTFEQLSAEDFCYLTTKGRNTGKPHTIEIWFALENGTLYLLSGGRETADWVKNLRADSEVTVRINSQRASVRARVIRSGTAEDLRARELLDLKYMGWKPGRAHSQWARTALSVALDLAEEARSR